MTEQIDYRAECMKLRAVIASLENKQRDIERHSEYMYGLYQQTLARVIEMENA